MKRLYWMSYYYEHKTNPREKGFGDTVCVGHPFQRLKEKRAMFPDRHYVLLNYYEITAEEFNSYR